MKPSQTTCAVCDNPQSPRLTPGQIGWHNHDHPAPAPQQRSRNGWNGAGRGPVMVVLRPGDRLIYESIPGSYEEIEVAALLALKPGGKIATCARCRRQVVPANPGSTTAMLARSLLSRLFNR